LRKHNDGNTFTNNKLNHSTRCCLPRWFKKGVWGDVSVFRCTHNHLRTKFKFRELLDHTPYVCMRTRWHVIPNKMY
jgi:hypothetical protein